MPPTNSLLSSPTSDEAPERGGPTFKIFSDKFTVFEKDIDGVQRKMLSCTASSTIKDLHGDRMTAECVQGMAPQAKSKGMTIFLNHSYKVPEDVFGKTVDARIVQRSHDENGDPIYDLDLEIMLNEANPRALDTYRTIKDEQIKLGVSIGAMIEDWDYLDEEAGFWGGLEIKAVDLLEASVVGIPANQRSWVVNGLKALGAPEMVVRKAAGLTYKDPNPKPEEEEPEAVEAAGCSDCKPGQPCAQHKAADPTIEVEASAAPDEESPEEEADEAEGDELDPADEMKEVTPPLVAAADAVEALKSAGADAAMLEVLLSVLEGVTEEVTSLRKDNEQLTTELAEARQDVLKAAEIVETIAKTPLGRKAQFERPVSHFRARFAGFYDEGILKILEGDND